MHDKQAFFHRATTAGLEYQLKSCYFTQRIRVKCLIFLDDFIISRRALEHLRTIVSICETGKKYFFLKDLDFKGKELIERFLNSSLKREVLAVRKLSKYSSVKGHRKLGRLVHWQDTIICRAFCWKALRELRETKKWNLSSICTHVPAWNTWNCTFLVVLSLFGGGGSIIF